PLFHLHHHPHGEGRGGAAGARPDRPRKVSAARVAWPETSSAAPPHAGDFLYAPGQEWSLSPPSTSTLRIIANAAEVAMPAHLARAQHHPALSRLEDRRLLRELGYVGASWTAAADGASF